MLACIHCWAPLPVSGRHACICYPIYVRYCKEQAQPPKPLNVSLPAHLTSIIPPSHQLAPYSTLPRFPPTPHSLLPPPSVGGECLRSPGARPHQGGLHHGPQVLVHHPCTRQGG